MYMETNDYCPEKQSPKNLLDYSRFEYVWEHLSVQHEFLWVNDIKSIRECNKKGYKLIDNNLMSAYIN